MILSEILIVAICCNAGLSLLAYVTGYRALMIAGSLVWVIISLTAYEETESLLIMGTLILIAVGQAFMPGREERPSLTGRRR